ncbi:hypothetical protein [Rhizobium rhizosphaerae]|nr:hypothetical protein [Xaviernesmea rhizosphaerae]
MSAQLKLMLSKLTFPLVAATALFVLNPSLLPESLRQDSTLRAEDMTSPGLGELLDGPAKSSGRTSSVNAALAPPTAPAQTDGAPALPAAAVKQNVRPGENPFLSPGKDLTAAASAARAPASVQAMIVPAAPQMPAAPDTAATPVAVNPFDTDKSQDGARAALPIALTSDVDVTALRYYATSKDLKRLGAEMRRLKELYPDWQPPKDLFAPVVSIDEQPLWELYAKGDYAGIRAEIARIQSANPKWQPSEDLTQKLQAGETRSLINSAYKRGRWAEVLSTAQAAPQIMVCQEMQVQWNVAESFARLKNYAEAFDVYHYILTSCDDPAMRLSTVQKAGLLLPPAGTASLIALGRTMPDGSSEFDDISFDGLRREIGSFIQKGDFASMPNEQELSRFVEFIQQTNSGKDATLIGWYFYSQKDWASANGWFIQAAKYQRDPKSIEGVILTLRNMDRPGEALQMARRYMTASPEIAKQYIEIISASITDDKSKLKLEKGDTETFEKVVAEQKSPLGGQALGWKYLADGDKAAASDWFNKSVSWEPTEGGVIGLAVLAARAKNYATLTALKSKYGSEFEGLKDFRVYKVKPYRAASAKPVKLKKKPEEKRGLFWFMNTNG